MQAQLQVSRVEDCLQWLESAAEGYTASQSISWLIDQVGLLCASLAFSGTQMSVAKKELNKAKARAYEVLVMSSHANQQYFSPMLAKDYVSAKCEKEQYAFDICDRCNRTITHQIEALRTCISALKMEAAVQNYQS